jgi:HlyD family secretion protein
MHIIAPFDGTVLYLDGTVGENVKTGTSGVILADSDHYFAEVLVDEADISLVEKGQPALVSSDAMPEVDFTGTVTSINPVGKTANGLVKYTVIIALDPVETQIMLGSTADAVITVGDENANLAVPLEAVHSGASGEYVEVLRDGAVVQVGVVSGDIIDDLVIVTGDLADGDEIVISYESEMNLPGFSR